MLADEDAVDDGQAGCLFGWIERPRDGLQGTVVEAIVLLQRQIEEEYISSTKELEGTRPSVSKFFLSPGGERRANLEDGLW